MPRMTAALTLAILLTAVPISMAPGAQAYRLSPSSPSRTSAALGRPAGCGRPAAIPAIEAQADGTFMIYLWWDPTSGALGAARRGHAGWEADWWECIGPPPA